MFAWCTTSSKQCVPSLYGAQTLALVCTMFVWCTNSYRQCASYLYGSQTAVGWLYSLHYHYASALLLLRYYNYYRYCTHRIEIMKWNRRITIPSFHNINSIILIVTIILIDVAKLNLDKNQ